MKTTLATALLLLINSAALGMDATAGDSTSNPPVQGRISVTLWPDDGNDFISFEFRDEGDKVVGEGTGAFASSNDTIYLERKGGTLTGFIFGVPYSLNCTSTSCQDQGSSDANFALEKKSDGLHYDGTLSFEPVDAVVSPTKISVSSDGSFEATGSGDGHYSGSGAFDSFEVAPSFHVDIVTEGTLKNFSDPSLFILATLQPFTHIRW